MIAAGFVESGHRAPLARGSPITRALLAFTGRSPPTARGISPRALGLPGALDANPIFLELNRGSRAPCESAAARRPRAAIEAFAAPGLRPNAPRHTDRALLSSMFTGPRADELARRIALPSWFRRAWSRPRARMLTVGLLSVPRRGPPERAIVRNGRRIRSGECSPAHAYHPAGLHASAVGSNLRVNLDFIVFVISLLHDLDQRRAFMAQSLPNLLVLLGLF